MNPEFPARLKSLHTVVRRLGRLLRLRPEKQLDWFVRLRHINKYLRYAPYRQWKEFEPLRAAVQNKWASRKGGRLLAHLEMLFPAVQVLRTYPLILDWVVMGYSLSSTYSGKVTFFWHREEALDRGAWQKVIDTNEAEVHILPGTQKTLITDHLADLADLLKTCIHKARATDAK